MDSPAANENSSPPPGLPPVQPPSGRFIIQLFVVPGILIAVVVLGMLLLSYLNKTEREPNYFLHQLDSDNADIRWRGMSDLAQILKRPEPAALRWKANAKFALDLVERVDLAFTKLLDDEKILGAQIAKSTDKDKELLWRKLRTQRDHLSFLASALGEFHVPVGAPMLCKILEHDASPDLKGNTLRRRTALWALMNLGENLKGFAKLPAEHQKQAIAALKEEVSATSAARAGWARTALYYLDKSALPAGAAKEVETVEKTLVACADSDDRFVRELVAMAFNFWDGEQAEATLLKLAADDGHGTLIRVEEKD